MNAIQADHERLNAAAEKILSSEMGVDPADDENNLLILDSLLAAAAEGGWHRTRADRQCHLYEHEDGRRVNLWISGTQHQHLGDGGLGFDDQTNIWDD